MKYKYFGLGLILFLATVGVIIFLSDKIKVNDKIASEEPVNSFNSQIGNNMKIESSQFQNSEKIPTKYTCDGADINPPLKISDVPDGAKSLVLIMDDPDAPGGTWVHWTIWNILSDTTEIPENSFPSGAIQGITSSKTSGYHGPCPPSGVHRYFFKLFALDSVLDLPADSQVSQLMQAMNGHILEQSELIGVYSRE